MELKGVTATVKVFDFSGFILCFGDVRNVCFIWPPFKLVLSAIELSLCRLGLFVEVEIEYFTLELCLSLALPVLRLIICCL